MDESAALLASPFATAIAALFGLVWGSFCNVVIARVPRGESIARPGSRCESCSTPIRAIDNIPLVSYVLLRGRCRSCGAPFSARYPLVEALAGILAAAIWLRFVAGDPAEVTAIRMARFALYFAFAATLLVLSFIDLRTRLLPDVITLPGTLVFFLAGFGAHAVPWLDRLIGAVGGYLFIRLISDFYYYVLKREGMGLGDGKLLALIGAVLGWKALPFVLFVGAFLGALVSLPIAIAARRRAKQGEPTPLGHTQIPFGPFLAIAALAYLFGATAAYERLLLS